MDEEIKQLLVGPKEWLHAQAISHGCKYLLLIADDAVGFGRVDEKGLSLNPALDPVLTKEGIQKLQQLYLFGEGKQLFAWRSDGELKICWTPGETGNKGYEIKEETYLLWGSASGKKDPQGFSEILEEERGFRFYIPLNIPKGSSAGLVVHHHCKEDGDGQMYIAYSRLIDLVQVTETRKRNARRR